MILRHCCRGCEPQKEPLTWAVWAWNRADGVRVAYKQKLCLACVASVLAPLYVACESPESKCPGCGIDTSDDMDPVYLSFIPKGIGLIRAEAPFCPSCAAIRRIWAQEGAEYLEDRDRGAQEQNLAPRYGSLETWRALGLPVERENG